jgi:hypothetical protein
MDTRQYERFRTTFDVRVTDLTWDEPAIRGEMVDVAAAGICVVLPREIAPGDMVRVDFSEGSIFGQVIHVSPGSGGHRTGIEVFDVLLEKSDLGRLVEGALQGRAEEERPNPAPANR